MKKLKKLFAVMLSLIMVLAMGITSFADTNPATITVNNLDANATLHYVQIVQPNTSTETGWEFTNGAAASFKKVTKFANLTDQQILWSLIKLADVQADVPEGTITATTADFQDAMEHVQDDLTYTDATGNTITANSAGIYAIKATTTDTANYVYSPMAAYVKFDNYDRTTGVPKDLVDVTVNAKKTTIKIEKTNSDTNGVVEIDSIVEYTVRTNVPYIADDVDKVTYTITDKIEGAEYVTNAEGKVAVTVKIGTATEETRYADVTTKDGRKQFVLNLSDVAADRNNANKDVVLTYQAKVTSEVVRNEVVPGDGSHKFVPAVDTLYTGKVTLTKTGENSAKLADAKFVLYRTETIEKEEGTKESVKKYALVLKDTTKTNNEYVVTGWTNNEADAKAETNLIVTDSNGQAVVRGLDSTYTEESSSYYFEEVVAPNGYSINDDDSIVGWGANQTANATTGTASMSDTKLSALPETGGIGTTIFTIVGCGIMIAAAGLFFASRRKENR